MKDRNRNRGQKATRPPDRDEMARVIHSAWKADLLPQKETCSELGIDQGQFSKIVNGKFSRPSGHAASLYAYANMQLRDAQVTPVTNEDAVAQQLVQVVLATWDKTEAGAQALSSAIKAMGRLQEVARHRR